MRCAGFAVFGPEHAAEKGLLLEDGEEVGSNIAHPDDEGIAMSGESELMGRDSGHAAKSRVLRDYVLQVQVGETGLHAGVLRTLLEDGVELLRIGIGKRLEHHRI